MCFRLGTQHSNVDDPIQIYTNTEVTVLQKEEILGGFFAMNEGNIREEKVYITCFCDKFCLQSSKQVFYFGIKELGRSLLGIVSPRTLNNLFSINEIMKEVHKLSEFYNINDLHSMLLKARESKVSRYVPFKKFNGVCMSKYNSNNCEC